MSVTVETKSGLERLLKIQVPADIIDDKINTEINDYAKKARIKGFRPGKVPTKVIKEKFGADIRRDVVNELMRTHLQLAITEQKLDVVNVTRLEPTSDQPGADLEYEADLEVFPEFDLAAADKQSVELVEVEIGDNDVELEVQKFCKSHATWEDVDRPAVLKDQVVIDFVGSMDGEEFEGGSGEGITLELGSKRMIEGFEDGLVGVKAGGKKTLALKFPDAYFKEDLAGKPVQFEVTVQQVQEAKLPELTDEFIKEKMPTGASNIDEFKEKIRDYMKMRLDKQVQEKQKSAIFESWLDAHDIELPVSSVQQTVAQMAQDMQQRFGVDTTSEQMRNDMEVEAKRRVKLSILCQKYADTHELKPDQEKVRARAMEELSQVYDPKQRESLVKDQGFISHIQGLVQQDQISEQLSEQMNKTTKTMSYTEFMEAAEKE